MAKFRAKARAVELLGKGQIADLPTAITELWKNGYDAYGDHLSAQLFFPEYKDTHLPFFVLSDDGVGMSNSDILEKWIVLGTDSKTRKTIPEKPSEATLNKTPRMPTGEKGIGRLSVAYLGNQMLMLTKKINEPLQALFFDWRILDNYHLYIDDIEIPILPIKDASEFDSVWKELLQDYKKNLPLNDDDPKLEKWEEQPDLKAEILKDLSSIKVPTYFLSEIIEPLCAKTAHGTKFVIFDPIDQLLFLKDHAKPDEENEDTIEFIRSGLSGMSNVFKEEQPVFDTSFLIYDSETPTDFIHQREFFDHQDFKYADHLIEGSFDEYGVFNGDLKIYNNEVKNHLFKPNKKRAKTSFGSFNIKIASIPGAGQPTLLNPDLFNRMDSKLKRVGGLYLYRDGFRILPYGRKDWDFLEFEERRSRGAGHYFFSYRRIWGYIELSRDENSSLIDKAGREGLINNKAYREFKATLVSFFIDLARKYYGKGAEFDIKTEQQEEIEQQKQEGEREKEERKQFIKNLKVYPKELEELHNELKRLTEELEKKAGELFEGYENIEKILARIDEVKIKINRLQLEPPKKFIPNDSQRKQLYDYQKQRESIEHKMVNYTNAVIVKAQDKLKEKELLVEFKRKLAAYEEALMAIIRDYEVHLQNSFSRLQNEFDQEKSDELESFRKEYGAIQPTEANREKIYASLKAIEGIHQNRSQRIKDRIQPFVEHLSRLSIGLDEDALVGYYKLEFVKLREKWQETQELAQLGIAVEIIDHQFNALYSKLAKIIDAMKGFVSDEEDSTNTYALLRTTFEHLENNYKLLTPLYRTTNRIRKDISGQDIFDYVQKFFEKEFREKEISVNCSSRFLKASFFTYESILKPVFINIINNAVYWLNSVEDRKIIFDFMDSKIVIANSGEPIDEVYINDGDLFKAFFSRRPKGRGIGLYLAKTTLNSVGYEITATQDPKYNQLNGACFLIYKETYES